MINKRWYAAAQSIAFEELDIAPNNNGDLLPKSIPPAVLNQLKSNTKSVSLDLSKSPILRPAVLYQTWHTSSLSLQNFIALMRSCQKLDTLSVRAPVDRPAHIAI
jgi:hypothetical protein